MTRNDGREDGTTAAAAHERIEQLGKLYEDGWITRAELEAMTEQLESRNERPPATRAA